MPEFPCSAKLSFPPASCAPLLDFQRSRVFFCARCKSIMLDKWSQTGTIMDSVLHGSSLRWMLRRTMTRSAAIDDHIREGANRVRRCCCWNLTPPFLYLCASMASCEAPGPCIERILSLLRIPQELGRQAAASSLFPCNKRKPTFQIFDHRDA